MKGKKEIVMKENNIKFGRIFWAILILGGGVLLALSAMGIGLESDPFKIVGSLLLLGVAISSLVKLRFFFTFLPLAGIAYIWRDLIGFPDAQLWPLLGAGALIGIALSILFHRKHEFPEFTRRHGHRHGECEDGDCSDGMKEVSSETLDADEAVTIEASFGETTKYLHSDHLKRVDVNANFAECKVYFDQCKVHPDGLTVHVSASFCGVELMIPRVWAVENKISSFAAAVNDTGRETTPSEGRVTLTGSLNFAEVKIIRV
jgi:hypothetical protein